VARTSISVEIARPSAQVGAYMADMANMSSWTNMQRMDLDGPLAAGTTGAFDLPMMGRRRTFPFVITAYEEGRRWAIRVTNRLGLAFDYVLVPTTSGTRVEQAIEVRPSGFLRPAGPLLVRIIRGEELRELRQLKAALEAPPAQGG